MGKLTMADVTRILSDVTYRDWCFHVSDLGRGYYLQVLFRDEAGQAHGGRKWYVSPWSTRSEVVQTALKAVLSAEEHEAREKFLYRGSPIFGPHFHVDKLHDLVQRGDALDVRPPREETA